MARGGRCVLFFDIESLLHVLLAMYEFYPDIEFTGNVLGGVLCAVYRPVLTTGASVSNHEICKSAVDVTLYGSIYKRMAVFKEGVDLSVVFQEFDYIGIKPGERLVAVVFARIINGSAVEYVSAAVSCGVVRNAFFIREAENSYGEPLAVEPVCELLHVDKPNEQFVEVWVLCIRFLQKVAEVGYSKRHALHEVRFFFEITAESICSEYLECAEENEMTQALEEFLTSDWEIFVERL